MIGKVYLSVVEFYNTSTHKTNLKTRPVIIISSARNNDYTVLPISTITRSENIDPIYDIPVTPEEYPLLGLNRKSYLRTHKQTPIHQAALVKEIGDIKGNYPDLYLEVLEKWDQFHTRIIKEAL